MQPENSLDLGNIGSMQVALASPEEIRKWSHGEVTKPETINYKTHKPEVDGLFCEKIFGPKKDNECRCGKYKKGKHVGLVCGQCGVEVTTSKVRRIRMGHIELETPIAHYWYYKGIPSRMSIVLDIPQKDLEKVLIYALYIVTEDQNLKFTDENGATIDKTIRKLDILRIDEYENLVMSNRGTRIRAGMGGETIRDLLKGLDLQVIANSLKAEISQISAKETKTASDEQNKLKMSKRLDTIEMFLKSGVCPSNMMLEVLPVIPPDLRPLLQLEGGRFGTSDLTEFYRKIIYRNNTLKKQKVCGAPSVIINQQKRMLQTAVDALFENSKRSKPFTGSGNRPLKSLSDMLRGKQGRFRQNLLGKRVDYSGRSVIVVGPELKIYQCGVPKEMALELFKPFVIRKLASDYPQTGTAGNQTGFTPTAAEKAVEKGEDARVWSSLEKVIKSHPVLLNRAPTLHRLGIQAFEPVLVEGKALKLHPLVCTAFNADFDGDQMAIHIPLSVEAQTEARFLMLSINNLLAPKDGKPITVPTQDMVLGSYYLTFTEGDGSEYNDPFCPSFNNFDDAKRAYDLGMIKLHTPIKVRRYATWNGEEISGIINTTVGKLIFNQAIPQDIGIIDRSKRENAFTLEVDTLVKKGTLTTIIDNCIKTHGLTKSAEVIDMIKAQGYKYSTRGALTVSVADITIPDIKEKMLREAEAQVEEIRESCMDGMITEEQRYEETIKIWNTTTENLTNELKKSMSRTNPIYMMSDSGARGSMNQIKQLAGMRGLMSDTSGRTIEIPIKANFREGLDIIEFFISSHGTRKTLSDTALRTADSGYLTRRLVYASQDVVIRQRDCGTHKGIVFRSIIDPDKPTQAVVPLEDRIRGRYLSDDLIDEKTGEVIATRDDLIDDDIIKKIIDAGITAVKVRSTIECEAGYGVCAKCYGSNLATNTICNDGDVVGIIAAQSIGEPGTQLTMRTFHTGGIATADNITQGLPRVEELFEARKPKVSSLISRLDGTVEISSDNQKKGEVKITVTADDGEEWSEVVVASQLEYQKDSTGKVIQPPRPIASGAKVKKGEALTKGSKDPHDVMNVLGISAVENYIIEEVQKVYNSQGVKINDRHLEIIVRQMLRNVKVLDAGDTDLIAGNVVENSTFIDTNKRIEKTNERLGENVKKPAKGERLLLGITKAVIASDSFLSAASFQETTKVLTEAAINGKRDNLKGLKENILVGKLIPAGTGLDAYTSIQVSGPVPENVEKLRKAQALINNNRASNSDRENSKYANNENDSYAYQTQDDGEALYGGNSEEFPVPDMEGMNTIMDADGNVTDFSNEEFLGGGDEYDADNMENDYFGNEEGEENQEELFGDETDPDLVDNDDGSDF